MRRFTLCLSLLVLMVLAATGCLRGIGSKRLHVDRTAYIEGLSASWKEQLLFNLVKLRYGDAPTFLDVTSITQSYQLQASASVDYLHPFRPGQRSAILGGAGSYQTTPTITYTPVTGDAMQKTLITPIKAINLFRALQTGWDPGFIFPYCVKVINNLRNDPDTNQDMGEFAKLWKQLTDQNALFITFEEEKEDKAKKIEEVQAAQRGGKGAEKKNATPKLDKLTDYLIELASILVKKQKKEGEEGKKAEAAFVNLDPGRAPGLVKEFKKKLWPEVLENTKDWERLIANHRFKIVEGYQPREQPDQDKNKDKDKDKDRWKIYVHSRSVTQVLLLLSRFINVPDSHQEWVHQKREKWFNGIKRINVEVTRDLLPKPVMLEKTDAFVGVKYKGYWFYITDSDLNSKDVFTDIIGIFIMMEPVSKDKDKPLLTLPVR